MNPILVEIQGGKEIQAGFARLSSLFSDLSPVFEKLGEKFFPLVQKKFDEGGPGWPSLKKETEAKKAKALFGPSRILVATGMLYESFAMGAPGSIERIKKTEAEFGSNIFYGIFHQEGKGVPERKIIDVTEAQEDQLLQAAQDDLSMRIRELGFEVN